MKFNPLTLKLSMLPLAALVALSSPEKSRAQTNGTWTPVAGGPWPTATNWAGSNIASGAGAVADFSTIDINATRTVTLDAARTVGTLIYGDATTVSNDQVLNTGTAGPLTLDVASGKAGIKVLNRTATIGAVLAGDDGILVSNGTTVDSTLILGAANTFTGGLDIDGVIVQFNNNGAANSGANANPITLGVPGGNPSSTTRLTLNSGINNASAITIAGDVKGVAGFGILHYGGTGLGTFSGPIQIDGNATAGGHLAGGNSAANALVLSGPITSPANPDRIIAQRLGFVRYGGGGTGYKNLLATDTVQVGATDGIATSATVQLGGSGNSTLDLNGFDQRLAGVTLGNTSAFTGTIGLGAKILTLDGDLTTYSQTAGPVTHLVNAGTGGSLNSGAAAVNLLVNDNPAADDLVINAAALIGTGGFVKQGDGTLALAGTTGTATLTVDTGALSIGRTGLPGTFSIGSLKFLSGTTLLADAGPGGDVANGGVITTTGTTTVIANQFGGLLPNGDYPILNYTGTSPGLAGFQLNTVGHTTSSLVDTGSAITLRVTDNKRVTWNGTNSTDWSTAASGNWKLPGGANTDYIESDDVLFPNGAASLDVDIPDIIAPSLITFDNTAGSDYTVTGTGGITGGTSLVKNNTGKLVLNTNNSYVGATTVNGGTLELDHDTPAVVPNGTNSVLSGTSGISLADGTALVLSRDDGSFNMTRSVSGTGSLTINPHSVAGSTALAVQLTGNNTGFSGPIKLEAPAGGTWRLQSPAAAALGTGAITVEDGAQIFCASGQTYNNPLNIKGAGYDDTNGKIGSLRLEGATWAGPVTLNGAATIGAHNGTGTITGAVSGGNLTANATNYNNNYILVLAGTNTYGTTTIGGQNTQTGGVPTMRLNIGANGTTGTLGTGPVTINGDGANGQLDFDRTDGYTLGAGQTLTGAGSNLTRTYVDINTRGTGFNPAGNAIVLGDADVASGGQLRIAQTRADSIMNADGVITAETVSVSVVNGGVLNLKSGTVLNANHLAVGQAGNAGGTVNQLTGSTANVKGQVRVGHFGTETSSYNLQGGALTLTGESPNLSPSSAGAGGANATGDNNINGLAVGTIVGGGIYLGIDGTGIFNHTGGNVTTNWIVLDQRGNSGSGANMPTGVDQYNLSNGTLAVRSTWGILQRNVSAEFNFSGGTIKIDNTGTGTGTGAALTIPIDADLKVSGTTAALDTNGAANAFTLPRSIIGTGNLALNGGGKMIFGNAGVQVIQPHLTGAAAIEKTAAGTTSVLGSGAGYTGAVTVSAGRLDLPSDATPSSITAAAGSALGGEPTTTTLTLNGNTVYFDPTTTGALTTTTLSVTGAVLLDFSDAALADGTYTAIKYTSKTGAGTFAVTGAANYRSISVADTGSAITVTIGGTKDLIWNGTGSSAWNVKTTNNWNPGADQFYLGDSVTFTDDASQIAVPITAGVAPKFTLVNSTKNYTFTSSGTGIGGSGALTKDGTGTLVLAGTNSYGGRTELKGGILAFANPASLGSGGTDNDILLQGGARLSYTGATAIDFGINRDVITGTGGGSLSHNSTTAATLTISGNLTGSDGISFHSNTTGAGTFALTGNNSGYTGNITVDAPGSGTGGLTTLRVDAQQAAPAGGSIRVNYPVGGASGNATTLTLSDAALPAAVGLEFTSLLSGTTSLRTQLTSTGASVVNGPIKLSGSHIVQFTLGVGSMSINGPVSEDATDGFTGIWFLRGGAGTGVVNGKVNLPAGTVAKTDANGWLINSTGNIWATTSIAVGSITLGADDALATGAPLNMGQNDTNAASLNLNGFDQTVSGLVSNPIAAGGNTTGKSITSTLPALFTINQDTDSTYASVITGSVSVLKKGAGTLTLGGASSNTGDFTVGGGKVIAGGTTVTSLGSATSGSRTVTVNTPGLLEFATNNVYGNGVNNSKLPATLVNGTTLFSSRYNVLGDLSLNNGGILDQAATDSGAYEGFQFRGTVAATGTGLATISSTTKANHLGPDTVFDIADTVAGPGTDLLVSSILRDQSGDFGQAAGGLTKSGAGILELTAASVYTGATNVNGGALRVSNLVDSATGTGPVNVNSGGILTGTGSITGPATATAGGTISPGDGPGTLFTGGTTLQGNSAIAWEIKNWTGTAGTDFDYLRVTGALTLAGTAGAPVVVRVSQATLTNFSAADRSFLLASATGGINGFDAAAIVVDSSGFTAGTGAWTVTKTGNDLYLNYSATAVVPPYDTWATSKGLAGADAVKSADPDTDGLSNIGEFAVNSEPKSGADSRKIRIAVATISGQSYLTLTLPVRTGVAFTGTTELSGTGSGVLYRLQGDTGLDLWTGDVDEVTPALDSDLPTLDSGWSYRTFRTAAPITSGGRQFLRGKFEAVP